MWANGLERHGPNAWLPSIHTATVRHVLTCRGGLVNSCPEPEDHELPTFFPCSLQGVEAMVLTITPWWRADRNQEALARSLGRLYRERKVHLHVHPSPARGGTHLAQASSVD